MVNLGLVTLYQTHWKPTQESQNQSTAQMSNPPSSQETDWRDTLYNNRRNVPREDNTRVGVTLELPPQANETHEHVPGVPTAPTLWVDLVERHKQELLNGVADMRTKLLDSYFFLIFILVLLHFLTYIQFLCTL